MLSFVLSSVELAKLPGIEIVNRLPELDMFSPIEASVAMNM